MAFSISSTKIHLEEALVQKKIISIVYSNPHILFTKIIFGFINGIYFKKHRHFLKAFKVTNM